jgi:hypothetical protein
MAPPPRTAAAFLVEMRVACAPSLEIHTASVRDEDEGLRGAALLGEKGDIPSLTDPHGSVRVWGGGGLMWRRRGWGYEAARGARSGTVGD